MTTDKLNKRYASEPAFCVWKPKAGLLFYTIADNGDDSIICFLENVAKPFETWEPYKQKGYKVLEVLITPVKEYIEENN